jgi:hypothetical protein
MIRTSISAAAFEAIAATLPFERDPDARAILQPSRTLAN